VAEHVVKADVASLYPSLIRAFRIGPSCDHLGVFLHLIDRLTELRLFHKAAARSAPPGSMEADQHDGTQTAMKTMINAAYGYLGATSMALFADLGAANEVTRRGRALLDGIIEALRERGMVPVEADTDGVYFCTPQDWSEAEERALVDEVGATLPAGVRLDFENRYTSMVSHAIKNYSLLSYNGEMIVRGAAMRSSRSEPFGVRFLLQAFRCAMQGDIAGIAQAYQETQETLRLRLLPASDVATRVRLSKDSKTYLAKRAKHTEAQYEALLAAGRTQWRAGERVRFYRAQHGASVWLPDEADDASPIQDEEEADELEEAWNPSSRPHRVLLWQNAGTTTFTTTCACYAIRTPSGCVWCLSRRTSSSCSAWTRSGVCLIDPSKRCSCAGSAAPPQPSVRACETINCFMWSPPFHRESPHDSPTCSKGVYLAMESGRYNQRHQEERKSGADGEEKPSAVKRFGSAFTSMGRAGCAEHLVKRCADSGISRFRTKGGLLARHLAI
jgi:hypothetical protein